MASTPAENAASSRLVRQASRAMPGHGGPGHSRRADLGEASQHGRRVEGHHHRPEARAVQRRQVMRDVHEARGQAIADDGEGRTTVDGHRGRAYGRA